MPKSLNKWEQRKTRSGREKKRESEREKERGCLCQFGYLPLCLSTPPSTITTHTQREREREREEENHSTLIQNLVLHFKMAVGNTTHVRTHARTHERETHTHTHSHCLHQYGLFQISSQFTARLAYCWIEKVLFGRERSHERKEMRDGEREGEGGREPDEDERGTFPLLKTEDRDP